MVRYATERSFDICMWQTVERKDDLINQATRAEPLTAISRISATSPPTRRSRPWPPSSPLILAPATVSGGSAPDALLSWRGRRA